METKEIIKHALKDYQNITGLRSYVVYDNTVIQSASEKSVRNVQRKHMRMREKSIMNVCIPVMQVSSNGRYRYSVEISTVLSSVKVFSP